MRVICAWCGEPLGGRGSLITHGICRACLAGLFEPQFGFMESVQTVAPARGCARRRNRRVSTAPAHLQVELFADS